MNKESTNKFDKEKPAGYTSGGALIPARYGRQGMLASSDNYGAGELLAPRSDLYGVVKSIRSHKLFIALIVVVCLAALFIQLRRMTPWYRAAAIVELGREGSTVLQSGGLTINDEDDPYFSINLKTKMLTLDSPEFQEDVVARLKLDQDPYFLELSRKRSLLQSLKYFGSHPNSAYESSPARVPVDMAKSTSNGATQRSAAERARLTPFAEIL